MKKMIKNLTIFAINCALIFSLGFANKKVYAEDHELIKDANLKEAIINQLMLESDTTLTEEHLELLIELSTGFSNISDLSGLEYASNLEALHMFETSVSDFTPLQHLYKLNSLSLYNSNISSISSISNLKQVEILDLSFNQITDLDNLDELTELTHLNLSFNPINNFDALENMINLKYLNLSNTGLIDTSFLSNINQIEELILQNNAIKSISESSLSTTLQYLDLGWNYISDINFLENLSNLNNLSLSNNRIENIEILENLTSLASINLNQNRIKDISGLSNLSQLAYLNLEKNFIANIDSLEELKEIHYLNLNYNFLDLDDDNILRLINQFLNENIFINYDHQTKQVDDEIVLTFNNSGLEMSIRNQLFFSQEELITNYEMTKLDNIWGSYYNINDSDLLNLMYAKNLQSLYLAGNQIYNLEPLSNLTNLKTIDLNSNKIVNLSHLEGLNKLESLSLKYNRISDLSPLASMHGISDLDLKGNNIININSLRDLNALRELDLSDNFIDLENEETALIITELIGKGVNLLYENQNIFIEKEEVVFADSSLDNIIRNNLGLSQEDELTTHELARLTYLWLNYENITNLSGLEYVANLEFIHLDGNYINDFSPLENLTKLRGLEINFIGLENLLPISNLSQIEHLSVRGNQITELQPLIGFTNLKHLDISWNSVTDINVLSTLNNIETLNLLGNQIFDITPINQLSGLRDLNVSSNPISIDDIRFNENLMSFAWNSSNVLDISFLTNFPNLENLDLSFNQIQNIEVISNLAKLKILNLIENRISDISSLANLSDVETLVLEGNYITDISNIENLKNLTSINLNRNFLDLENEEIQRVIQGFLDKQIDVSYEDQNEFIGEGPVTFEDKILEREIRFQLGLADYEDFTLFDLAKLTHLFIDHSGEINLSGIELAQNIVDIVIQGAQIQDLSPLTNLNKLSSITFYNTEVIDYLNLASLTGLKQLIITDEKMSMDDLAKITLLENIEYLSLHNTKLSDFSQLVLLPKLNSLDLIGNMSLNIESIENLTNLENLVLVNDITDLTSLSNFQKLKNLSLSNNQIYDISPLFDLKNLEYLNLSGNKISSINGIGVLTNLYELDLGYNKLTSIDPLSQMTNLLRLNLSYNRIESITPLSSLTKLQSLDLTYNNIVDITNLINLNSLYTLHLSYNFLDLNSHMVIDIINQLSNNGTYIIYYDQFTPVAPEVVYFSDIELQRFIKETLRLNQNEDITTLDLVRLDSLHLINEGVKDLTGLEHALNIQQLYIKEEQLVDISSLPLMPNLLLLSIESTSINDEKTSIISSVENLRYLYLSNSTISDFSFLSNLVNLTSFGAIGLNVTNTSLNNGEVLKQLPNLKSLTLNRTSITDFSFIKDLYNLTNLYLVGNGISDITFVSDLINLNYLNLSFNLISDISSLSLFNNIENLNLAMNFIDDYSALEHVNISYLDLSNNKINELSVLNNVSHLNLISNYIQDISKLVNFGLSSLNLVELTNNYIDIKDNSTINMIHLLSNQGVFIELGKQSMLTTRPHFRVHFLDYSISNNILKIEGILPKVDSSYATTFKFNFSNDFEIEGMSTNGFFEVEAPIEGWDTFELSIYHPVFKQNFVTKYNNEFLPLNSVERLELDFYSSSLSVDEYLQIEATITPEGANNLEMIWVSSDDSIATVNNEGLVHAISAGQVKIKAITIDGGFEAIANLQVVNVPVTGIEIINRDIIIDKGLSTKLDYIIHPSDADIQSVSWHSSNPTIANVDENGNVYAHQVGEVIITVISDAGDFQDSIVVTINENQLDLKYELEVETEINDWGEKIIDLKFKVDKPVNDLVVLRDFIYSQSLYYFNKQTDKFTVSEIIFDGEFDQHINIYYELNNELIELNFNLKTGSFIKETTMSMNSSLGNRIVAELEFGRYGAGMHRDSWNTKLGENESLHSMFTNDFEVIDEYVRPKNSYWTPVNTFVKNQNYLKNYDYSVEWVGDYFTIDLVDDFDLTKKIYKIEFLETNEIFYQLAFVDYRENFLDTQSDMIILNISPNGSYHNGGTVRLTSYNFAGNPLSTKDITFEKAPFRAYRGSRGMALVGVEDGYLIINEGIDGEFIKVNGNFPSEYRIIHPDGRIENKTSNDGSYSIIVEGRENQTYEIQVKHPIYKEYFRTVFNMDLNNVEPVMGISMNITNVNLKVNDNYKLTATISPSSAIIKDILWVSEDKAIATVDNQGNVKAISPGTTTVKAISIDGGFEAITHVVVTQPVNSVQLNKTNISLDVGTSEQLVATINPSNASNKNVTWSSSNTKVATVDGNGLVKAIAKGVATIKVKTVDGGHEANATISVIQPVLGITLDKTSVDLNIGANTQLTATINPSNANNLNVTWTSSNANVATVNNSGKVTAIGAGEATITVTSVDGNKKATAKIVVKKVETEPAIVVGDLNNDGRVSITDLVMLRRYLAGIITLDDRALKAADLNKDSRVSITDLVQLRRTLAGLE